MTADRTTETTDGTETGTPSVVSVESVVRPGRKRSGGPQQGMEETVAAYGAARAFLLGEWFGGTLMVASFTLLYLFAFAPGRAASLSFGLLACLALLALGTLVYLRSRGYYQRIGFDYAPKWHRAAVLLAGSAGIFWLLFALLAGLTWMGVRVLPAP